MKAYFIKLFGYNQFATNQILETMAANGAPGATLKLMTHLLAAELIWLERCQLIAPTMTTPWPAPLSLEQCRQTAETRHKAWLEFLNGLRTEDFDHVIPYETFNGVKHENLLSEIITHVINHGTHTRAQIGQQLKFEGAKTLPSTDYSYYLRLLNN